jgi:hypothetical protein
LTPYFPQDVSLRIDREEVFSVSAPSAAEIISAPLSLSGASPGAIIIAPSAFVLVEGVIRQTNRANRQDRLDAEFRDSLPSVQDALLERLSEGLQARGYANVAHSVPRADAAFLNQYPTGLNATAVLDIVIDQFGYFAQRCYGERREFAYRPWLNARARLVRATDSAVLMRRTFTVSPTCFGRRGGVYVELDSKYHFADFENLEANPDLARDGLYEAINQLGTAIAGLLPSLSRSDRQ